MLKITVHDDPGTLRLQLEGGLAGARVCELEYCWHLAKTGHPNRTLSVDLIGVTFVDQAGRYLLRLMHRDGVCLIASGLMQQDIHDSIADATE